MPAFKSKTLIASLAVLLVLVIFAPVPHDTIATEVLHDFGHAPIFGVVALLVLFWLRDHKREMNTSARYAVALAVSCSLGLITEAIQIPVGRNADWNDVVGDVLGAVGFLSLFAMFDSQIANRVIRLSCVVLGSTALMIHSWPLARSTIAYMQRNAKFPVLFDARRGYDDFFLQYHEATGEHVAIPERYAQFAGEKALLLHLEPRWSPLLAVIEPRQDWRAYRALVFDVTNGSTAPLNLKFVVRDRDFDERSRNEFRRAVTLSPEHRATMRFTIADIERGGRVQPLDLLRIQSVTVRDEYAQEARDIYVSRIWLE